MQAVKIATPLTLILVASSLKQRQPKTVAKHAFLFFSGAMIVNEARGWNRLSGRLYLSMKSDHDN